MPAGDRPPIVKRLLVAGAVLLVIAAGAFALTRRSPQPSGPLIIIDAGHGGSRSGTTKNGLREQDINLAVALQLRAALTRRGYRVVMTRSDDSTVATRPIPTWQSTETPRPAWHFALPADSLPPRLAAEQTDLQARVDIADASNADAFISIHANDARDSSARGVEGYAFRADAPGLALAASVTDAVAVRTQNLNRGAHPSGLYVCRWTNMPAMLIETGYLSSPQDSRALRTTSYQRKVAEGIVDGLDRWFVSYPLSERDPEVSATDSPALSRAVANETFPGAAPAAVLLDPGAPQLAASAAALAATRGAPLLLTNGSHADTATVVTLARLGIRRVERIAGGDPLTQAAEIAMKVGLPPTGRLAIVDADDPAAIAAVAPLAAQERMPVLLSRQGQLPPAATAFLGRAGPAIREVLAVGCRRTPAQPADMPVTTLVSADPDELGSWLRPTSSSTAATALVVDAERPLDVAVAAAAAAARRGAPVVQVHSGVLGPWTREFITNRGIAAGAAGQRIRFLLLRNHGSVPPLTSSALHKSVGQ